MGRRIREGRRRENGNGGEEERGKGVQDEIHKKEVLIKGVVREEARAMVKDLMKEGKEKEREKGKMQKRGVKAKVKDLMKEGQEKEREKGEEVKEKEKRKVKVREREREKAKVKEKEREKEMAKAKTKV